MFRVEEYRSFDPDKRKVKDLYIDSFPKNERWAFPMLVRASKKDDIDLLKIYDDDTFAGFSFVIKDDELSLIYYLAIEPSCQDSGYGSSTLQYLLNNNPNHFAVVLETTHGLFEDIDTRIKRKAFFMKNGFKDTGCYYKDSGGQYDILGTSQHFGPEKYRALIKKFTWWTNSFEVGEYARRQRKTEGQ